MPIVTVQWLAGRTPAQKKIAAVHLTQVIADVGEVDPREVDVIFVDVKREDWMIGATVTPLEESEDPQ